MPESLVTYSCYKYFRATVRSKPSGSALELQLLSDLSEKVRAILRSTFSSSLNFILDMEL